MNHSKQNPDANQETTRTDRELSYRRSLWRLHRSTLVIAMAVAGFLLVLIIPGELSSKPSGKTGGMSWPPNIKLPKQRFHGWPAIHMVTWENYELANKNTNQAGRRIAQNSGLANAPGDSSNQAIAIAEIEKSFDAYEPNSVFWAFIDWRPKFSRAPNPDAKPPLWMDPANWTVGTRQLFQIKAAAINFSLAMGILLSVLVLLEFRRRRRNSFWQFSLLEFSVLIILVSVAISHLSSKYRDREVAKQLMSAGLVTQAPLFAKQVWLTRLIGVNLCKTVGNVTVKTDMITDENRNQLQLLKKVRPWMFHIEGFSDRNLDLVPLVPKVNTLWLTLGQPIEQIAWDQVDFGPSLEHLMVYSATANDRSNAKFQLRSVERFPKTFGGAKITFGGQAPMKLGQPKKCDFAAFESALAQSNRLSKISVNGFLIDKDFVAAVKSNRRITWLDLANCEITDEAYLELQKLDHLEFISTIISNLSDAQQRKLQEMTGQEFH